jgi:hypothetical protein
VSFAALFSLTGIDGNATSGVPHYAQRDGRHPSIRFLGRTLSITQSHLGGLIARDYVLETAPADPSTPGIPENLCSPQLEVATKATLFLRLLRTKVRC